MQNPQQYISKPKPTIHLKDDTPWWSEIYPRYSLYANESLWYTTSKSGRIKTIWSSPINEKKSLDKSQHHFMIKKKTLQ